MYKKGLLQLLLLFSLTFYGQDGHNHSIDKSSNRFIENKGQWDEKILFKSELGNASVYISQSSLIYQLKDNTLYNKYMKDLHDGKLENDSLLYYQSASILMEFEGASSNISPKGNTPYSEKRNYLIGKDSSKWARNVLSFPEIETINLYPNIDFKLYHSKNSMKYEFEVDPKTDYRQIQLKFTGQEELEIAPNGDLLIHNGVSDIIEDKPIAYQYIKGEYREVICAFEKINENTIGFILGKDYKRKYPVIIDPQLIFSTASGSTADNWGNTACLDESGNLYSGGTVFSSPSKGFPTTFGSFQRQFQGGGTDIGILKFDSSGQNLIYATYIGGDLTEIPTSIISNDKQELFILGVTSSDNFPGAVNTFSGGIPYTPVGGYSFEQGSDIIVIKLNSTGTNIIKSIYVGGPRNDGNNHRGLNVLTSPIINYGDQLRGEIIIDKEENIYIASSTNTAGYNFTSTNFPVKNGFDMSYNGGTQDGVVFKVDKSLDYLVWSSYIGSAANDAAMSLKLNSKNELLVTGVTGGTIQSTYDQAIHPYHIGGMDGFVAKISNDGSSLLQMSYLGTTTKDIAYLVELDQEDNVYILGQTYGDYGHYPNDVYHVPNEGVFIHKLGPNLDTSYFYSTIGDTLENSIAPDFSPTAFLVNECGNIFIAGWGGETNYPYNGLTLDLPITYGAIKPTSDGSDFYLAVFLQNMDSLLYATYFGVDGVAEHVDGGTSRFSDQGIVYQSVCAGCGGNQFVVFPNDSEGEYPKQNASQNCNNGVFKYDLSSLNARIKSNKGCGPLIQTFINETIGGVDYYWNFGDGTDTLVTNKSSLVHQYKTPGIYIVSMVTTDLTTCKRKDTTYTTVNVSDRLIPQTFTDTVCKGNSLAWSKYNDMGFTYEWTPKDGLSNSNIHNPTIKTDTTTRYFVHLTDLLGCIREDTIDVFIPYFDPNLGLEVLSSCHHNSKPKIELQANYKSNFKPDSLIWRINTQDITTLDSTFIFIPNSYGLNKVQVKTELKGCVFNDTSTINLPQIKVPNIITPNDDGKNDRFVIEGLETGGIWKLLVFNRWGKEVFNDQAYKNTWNAPIESAGTYFYELESPDGTKCKGWLQVVK